METWKLLKLFAIIWFWNCGNLSLVHSQSGGKNLNVGILLSWKGTWPAAQGTAAAILLAFEDLKQGRNGTILPGYNISWVWMDSQCEANQGVASVLGLIDAYEIHGFIGPPCSVVATRVAQIATFYGLPMISWAAASPLLSDKDNFPFFARTVGPYTVFNKNMPAILKLFGWKHVAILSSNDDLFSPTAEDLLRTLQGKNVDVVFYQSFTPVTSLVGSNSKLEWMEQLRSTGVRIIILLCYCNDMRDTLLTASELAMMNGYVYILYDLIEDCHIDTAGLNDNKDEEALHLFQGTLGLTWKTEGEETYASFLQEMDNRRMEFAPYSHPPSGPLLPHLDVPWLYESASDTAYNMPSINETQTIGSFATYLYEAIKIYYLAADATLAAGYDPRVDGDKVMDMIFGSNFPGLYKEVMIDNQGDRNPDMQIVNCHTNQGHWDLREVAVHVALQNMVNLTVGVDSITWPGGYDDGIPVDIFHDLPLCLEKDYFYDIYFCNPKTLTRVIHYSWNHSVNCSGGVSLPDDLEVDCDWIPLTSKTGYAVLSISLAGAFLCTTLCFCVWLNSSSVVMKSAQPAFLLIFVGSATVLSLSSICCLGKHTDAKCLTELWIFHVSFTSMFAGLFLKVYRVWRIVGNTKLKKIRVKVHQVLPGWVMVVGIISFLLMLWMLVDYPGAETRKVLVPNLGEIERTHCKYYWETGYFNSSLYTFQVILILTGMYISYQTRNVGECYSDSKNVMFAIYQIAIFAGLILLVTKLSSSFSLEIMFQALGWSVSCVVVTSCVVLPKIVQIHHSTRQSRSESEYVYGYDDSEGSSPQPECKANFSTSIMSKAKIITMWRQHSAVATGKCDESNIPHQLPSQRPLNQDHLITSLVAEHLCCRQLNHIASKFVKESTDCKIYSRDEIVALLESEAKISLPSEAGQREEMENDHGVEQGEEDKINLGYWKRDRRHRSVLERLIESSNIFYQPSNSSFCSKNRKESTRLTSL